MLTTSLGVARRYVLLGVFPYFLTGAGCTTDSTLGGDRLTGDLAAKAEAVAAQIGGPAGFGGAAMGGYEQHAAERMGFVSAADLADSAATVTIRMENLAGQPCTFHLSYVSAAAGVDEQEEEVEVPATGEVEIVMPCMEIVGLGSLETPGAVGCHLTDGATIPNTMAVPAFLNMDYACGAMHSFMLTPDVDDLDGDDDTEELILISGAMQSHMQAGGPMNHSHRGSSGGSAMMGGMMPGHGLGGAAPPSP
ncbi:MAG: hypothetical protein HY763_09385 [Planctomycetes bacterium]|nr:hypothetical protein [Planctomycetota bacterium]